MNMSSLSTRFWKNKTGKSFLDKETITTALNVRKNCQQVALWSLTCEYVIVFDKFLEEQNWKVVAGQGEGHYCSQCAEDIATSYPVEFVM